MWDGWGVRRCLGTVKFRGVRAEGSLGGLLGSMRRGFARRAVMSCEPNRSFYRFRGRFNRSMKVALYKRLSSRRRFRTTCCFPCFRKDKIAACTRVSIREGVRGRRCINLYRSSGVKVDLVFALRGNIRCVQRGRTNLAGSIRASMAFSKLTRSKVVLLPIGGGRRRVLGRGHTSSAEERLVGTTHGKSRTTVRALAFSSVSLCSGISGELTGRSMFSVISACFVPFKTRYSVCSVVKRVLTIEREVGEVANIELCRVHLGMGRLAFSVYIPTSSIVKRPRVKEQFGNAV